MRRQVRGFSRTRSRCSTSRARRRSSPARPGRSARSPRSAGGRGANVVIAGANADELTRSRRAARAWRRGRAVAKRPSSEENCEAIVEAAVARSAASTSSSSRRHQQGWEDRRSGGRGFSKSSTPTSRILADGAPAGRHMITQSGGGKVILMSSARGLLGHPAGYTAYCASKSAVNGITKALGCEWGSPASPSMRSPRRCFARR